MLNMIWLLLSSIMDNLYKGEYSSFASRKEHALLHLHALLDAHKSYIVLCRNWKEIKTDVFKNGLLFYKR